MAHRKVRLAIAIEVAHGHGRRISAHTEAQRGGEVSMTITEQHRTACDRGIDRRQIRRTVAVEVAHGHGDRKRAHAGERRLREGAVAIAQEDRDVGASPRQV